MKHLFLFLLFIASSFSVSAQNRYKLNSGEVSFFSSAPLEDIEAVNKKPLGVIDFSTKSYSFRIKIKDFVFPSSLMQEHFNENYLESEKFPNSTFKGKIIGDYDLKNDGVYSVQAKGKLTIHGVTKEVSIPSKISVKNGITSISSSFKVKLEDYDIEIPTIVFNKIAEVVEVKISGSLVQMDQ